jgi:hypothetical protein
LGPGSLPVAIQALDLNWLDTLHPLDDTSQATEEILNHQKALVGIQVNEKALENRHQAWKCNKVSLL